MAKRRDWQKRFDKRKRRRIGAGNWGGYNPPIRPWVLVAGKGCLVLLTVLFAWAFAVLFLACGPAPRY